MFAQICARNNLPTLVVFGRTSLADPDIIPTGLFHLGPDHRRRHSLPNGRPRPTVVVVEDLSKIILTNDLELRQESATGAMDPGDNGSDDGIFRVTVRRRVRGRRLFA
jgi:hypothetical protein